MKKERKKNRPDLVKMSPFGKWEVISYTAYVDGIHLWLCKCECGTIRNVVEGSLIHHKSKSCGSCIKRVGLRHGHSLNGKGSPAYVAFHTMRKKKGMIIQPEWLMDGGFVSFFNEVGPKPGKGYALRRIVKEKGFVQGNVRWEKMKRVTPNLEIDGKPVTMNELSKMSELPLSTVLTRARGGLSAIDIIKCRRAGKD